MELLDDGNIGITPDDVFMMLVVLPDSPDHITVVGPYKGSVIRARSDAQALKENYSARTLICRVMHPADLEAALNCGADELFGYAAWRWNRT